MKKPRGWTGKNGDKYYTKSTHYGLKYMCSECGRQVLGVLNQERMHWRDCIRLQPTEPAKESEG